VSDFAGFGCAIGFHRYETTTRFWEGAPGRRPGGHQPWPLPDNPLEFSWNPISPVAGTAPDMGNGDHLEAGRCLAEYYHAREPSEQRAPR
jgi:hypothetical protein